jgi:hypothetical protein
VDALEIVRQVPVINGRIDASTIDVAIWPQEDLDPAGDGFPDRPTDSQVAATLWLAVKQLADEMLAPLPVDEVLAPPLVEVDEQ